MKYFRRHTKSYHRLRVGWKTGPLEVGAVGLCDGRGRQTTRNVLKPSAVRVGCGGRKRGKKKQVHGEGK